MTKFDSNEDNSASKPAVPQTLSDGAQYFACYLIDNCENEVVREESVQAWLGKMLASPRYHPAAPAQSAEPIYQVRCVGESKWRDVTGDQYVAALNGVPLTNDVAPEDLRFRIVYAAPQPSPTAVVLDERADWHHELKTDPEVFAAVLDGSKTHEIRFNDRDFKIGDMLRLRETRYTGQEMRGPEPRPLEYTGRELTRVVSHVLEGYGLQPGWVILSFAASPQPVEQISPIIGTQAPFSNCRFKFCDLPGQCRDEGKCHHPAVSAAQPVEQTRALTDDVLKLIECAADCISESVTYEQDGFDMPPMPATEWDYNADQLAYALRALLTAARPASGETE